MAADILEVRVGPGPLRAAAVAAPLPEYPASSVARKRQGKVVAQIVLEPDGVASELEILEFTYPAMGASVSAALKQWKFYPIATSDGKPVRATGRLTFTFHVRSGKPVVIDEAALANATAAAKPAEAAGK